MNHEPSRPTPKIIRRALLLRLELHFISTIRSLFLERNDTSQNAGRK